jgi:hypothetical protein
VYLKEIADDKFGNPRIIVSRTDPPSSMSFSRKKYLKSGTERSKSKSRSASPENARK